MKHLFTISLLLLPAAVETSQQKQPQKNGSSAFSAIVEISQQKQQQQNDVALSSAKKGGGGKPSVKLTPPISLDSFLAERPKSPVLNEDIARENKPGMLTMYHRKPSSDYLALTLRAVREGHFLSFVAEKPTDWTSWFNRAAETATNEINTSNKTAATNIINAIAKGQSDTLDPQQKAMTLFVNGQRAVKTISGFDITQTRAAQLAEVAAQNNSSIANVFLAAIEYADRLQRAQMQLVNAAKASHPHPEDIDTFSPQHKNIQGLLREALITFRENENTRRKNRAEAQTAKAKEEQSKLEELAATTAKEKETTLALITAETVENGK